MKRAAISTRGAEGSRTLDLMTARLEQELEDAQLELQVAHVREELLLGMPEVMKPLVEKKNGWRPGRSGRHP